MSEIKISLESLARVLGKAPGEISEALKSENDEQKPQKEIDHYIESNFQNKLKGAISESRDEGFGRGKRESLTEIEKWIGSEFEIAPMGDIKAQIQKLKESVEKTEIKPEDIEKSDIFKSKLDTAITAVKTKLGEENERLSGELNSLRRAQVQTKLGGHLRSLLKENNFVLPEDGTIAKNIFNAYMAAVWNNDVDFKIDEGKDMPVMTDKEGNPVKDDMHNVLTVNDYALAKAKEYFLQRTGDGRDVSGNQTQGGGGGGRYVFKSAEEAMKAANAEKDPKTRMEILESIKSIKEPA